MVNSATLLIVGTRVSTELEAKFSQWYEGVHIPMLLESDAIEGAARYKTSPTPDISRDYPTQGETADYVVIHSFKDRACFEAWWAGPARAAARKEMVESGWIVGQTFSVTRNEPFEQTKAWRTAIDKEADLV